MGIAKLFTGFANVVSRAAGRPVTFGLACLLIVVWAISGPLFGFSDTWQLVINTGTTIVTFLMVFLIQNTQNRDGAALQAKLDEILRSIETARNGFVGIENLSDEELAEIIRDVEDEAAGGREKPDVTAHLEKLHAALDRVGRANLWR